MAVARGFLRPPGLRMRVRVEKDTEREDEALTRTRCVVTSKCSLSESYDTLGDGIAVWMRGWKRPMLTGRGADGVMGCPVTMTVIVRRPEQTGRLRHDAGSVRAFKLSYGKAAILIEISENTR